MSSFIAILQKKVLEYPRLLRVALFLFSGGTAATTQLIIYVSLTRVLGLQYLIASSIAFVCALFLSFVLQKFLTFNDRCTTGMHFQFINYAILAGFNFLANASLMFLLVTVIEFNDIISQIGVMLLVAVWSYLIYKNLIFESKNY